MTNDFTQIEAEAFAEHEAAKAKAVAAERAKLAAEDKKKEAELREARRARNVENSKHLFEIVKFLGQRTWAIDEEDFRLTIAGIDVSRCYSLEQRWSRGSGYFHRGSKPIGMKFVVNIGSFGERNAHSFKQKGNGTYNYEGIAEYLAMYADKQIVLAKLAKQRGKNQSAAKNLASQLFKSDSYQQVITASQDAEKPVFFKFEIKKAMTEKDAAKLAKTLRDCGISLHWDEK